MLALYPPEEENRPFAVCTIKTRKGPWSLLQIEVIGEATEEKEERGITGEESISLIPSQVLELRVVSKLFRTVEVGDGGHASQGGESSEFGEVGEFGEAGDVVLRKMRKLHGADQDVIQFKECSC